MNKRYTYDNGLPFSNVLDKNLDDLKKRIKLNKASMLIIDGAVGEGKTTLAVHCAEYFTGTQLEFPKQLGMGGEQFQEKLQICVDSKLLVVIYDEAGDFNSRGALTKFNQMLNRIFDTYRTFKILVIIVLPNFAVLDNSLFQKQIPRLLLHCHSRNNRYGNYSGYSLYRMYYLKKYMREITVTPQAYSRTRPNFVGHFLDVTPERSKELDQYSTEGKRQVLTDNIIENRGLVDLQGIAKAVGKSTRWVQKKISELNFEHNTTFKRKKYYDKDIINIILEN